MADSFLKLMTNNNTLELIKRPNLLALITLIAYRAKRTNDISVNGLEVGESFIGDYKNCGLTEQQYRTAKDWLSKLRLVRFRATNRGTVAKLLDKSIFDINEEVNNGQTTDKQRTNNGQTTTNKKERIKNKEIISSNEEIENESRVDRRNPEINKMLEALKLTIGISDFADSRFERGIAKHCLSLIEKIGPEEFRRRLEIILNDGFKRKNCNRIVYVYNEIKGFIEPTSSILKV